MCPLHPFALQLKICLWSKPNIKAILSLKATCAADSVYHWEVKLQRNLVMERRLFWPGPHYTLQDEAEGILHAWNSHTFGMHSLIFWESDNQTKPDSIVCGSVFLTVLAARNAVLGFLAACLRAESLRHSVTEWNCKIPYSKMFIMFFQLITKSYPGPVGLKSRILTNIHCILYSMR
jgi:hypothetical protein